MSSLGMLDLIILTVIGFSTLLGFFRGFITECLSLFVWVAAFYISAQYAPVISDMFLQNIENPFRSLLAFGGTFLIVLFAGGLLNIIITLFLRFLKISLLDRVLGIVFGMARGALIIGIITLLLNQSPLYDANFRKTLLDNIKSWSKSPNNNAKNVVGPIFIDILDGASIMAPRAQEWAALLERAIPPQLLKDMNSANLLQSTPQTNHRY